MLNIRTFLFALITTATLVVGSRAHVVIDNLEAGNQVFDSSDTSSDARSERATGVVSGDRSNQGGEDEDLVFLPTDAGRKKGRNSGGRKAGYLRRLNSNTGGSGGGGSRGRQPSDKRKRREDMQTIVPIKDSATVDQGLQETGDFGVDLPLYDQGSTSSGPGGGESPPTQPPPGESGPSSSQISGTPEPAALAVWAIAGCCGYGLVRCRQRWLAPS